MASEMAMQYASRAWCQPETSNKEMDVELGAAFAQVLDDWAEISNTTHLHQELEIVRNQRDAWWDTAYERMLLLQEAREFVIAYMKQCDVSCGIQGAEELLGRINKTTADLPANAQVTGASPVLSASPCGLPG